MPSLKPTAEKPAILAVDDDPEVVRAVARDLRQAYGEHFVDYNWDPRLGCPSFVTDPEGDQVLEDPAALEDVHAYVGNLARWLSKDLS